MLGALRLDERVFKEIEQDRRATYQAVVVVVLASIATGINVPWGGWLILPVVAVRTLAWYVLITVAVYLVGTRLFHPSETHASFIQLARVIGFALTPRIFFVFLFTPYIGFLVIFLVAFWRFAAMVVAVRQALGLESTTQAAWVVGIAFIPVMLLEPFLLGYM